MYNGQVSGSDKTQFYLNGLQIAQNGYDLAYQEHEIASQTYDSAHQTNEAARRMYETSHQTHESTRQIYEKFDKGEQVADVKIATNLEIRNEARGNVEKGETGIAQGQSKVQAAQSEKEKARIAIVAKIVTDNTRLNNKITLVSRANGMPSKDNILTQLKTLISENEQLKKNAQIAQSIQLLKEVLSKANSFSKKVDVLFEQIGKV